MMIVIEADSTETISKSFKIYFNDVDQDYVSCWVEEYERTSEGPKFKGEKVTCMKIRKSELRRLGKGF